MQINKITNNVVNNIMNSVANLELALGINAHWCNSCTIRNNIVHSISSNVRNGSTGILLSGPSEASSPSGSGVSSTSERSPYSGS